MAEDEAHADLAWGGRGSALTLPVDATAWEFRWDEEPDVRRDPLAHAFWWLARVEEQLAPEAAFDEHGRFRFECSALRRRDDPLAAPVDELALGHADALAPWRDAGEDPPWRIVATHDIDLPWRWTRTGRRRAIRALRDDLRSFRLGSASRGALALASIPGWRLRRGDPWCNARRILQLEAAHGAASTHYLLAASHVPEDGDAAQFVDRYLAGMPGGGARLPDGTFGLHGSYTSSEVPGRLAQERAQLLGRVGADVRDHRFHYLRHRPVEAWPELALAGFRSDSSLGYAEQPGFRAGTAHPYRAWDHDAGTPLDLVVIPLALMDATFDERYVGIGTGWAAQSLTSQVVDRVHELGGSASVLVHNDRLCNAAFPGWTKLYSTLLDHVREDGGVACTAGAAAEAYLELVPDWRRTSS